MNRPIHIQQRAATTTGGGIPWVEPPGAMPSTAAARVSRPGARGAPRASTAVRSTVGVGLAVPGFGWPHPRRGTGCAGSIRDIESTSFRPAVTCGSRHDRSAQPEQEIWDQACRRWADVHCLARKGDRVSRPERRGQDDNHPAAARPGQARHGRGQDRRQALPRSGRTSATSSPSSTCHRPTPTTAGCSRSCVTSDPDGPGRAGRWPRVRRSGARCR